MKIAIIDHDKHNLIIEEVSEETINEKYNHEEEDFIKATHPELKNYSWDYIINEESHKRRNTKKKVEGTFKVTCYDKTETFPESERANQIKFYQECACMSDGCEKERYMNIYMDLTSGCKDCKDEWY